MPICIIIHVTVDATVAHLCFCLFACLYVYSLGDQLRANRQSFVHAIPSNQDVAPMTKTSLDETTCVCFTASKQDYDKVYDDSMPV